MSHHLHYINLPVWMKTGDYPLAVLAFGFADEAHKDQVRKYTGEPYVYHCLDVAQRLHDLYGDHGMHLPDVMVAAAALHDTVEDCGVSFQYLTAVFGKEVAGLVFWLTDVCPPTWGNRAQRKRLEAERMAFAPGQAQIIKYCDIMSNTASIEEHDAEFSKTYVPEKNRVLAIIGEMSAARLWVANEYPYKAVE